MSSLDTLTEKQIALREFLTYGDAHDIARMFKDNHRTMSEFIGLKNPRLFDFFLTRRLFRNHKNHFSRLIDYLETGDENDGRVEKARERIDESLEAHSHLLPVKGLELTGSPLKKKFIAIERREEFWDAVKNVKSFLRNPLSSPLKLSKNIMVMAGGFIRLDRRDMLHIAMKGIVAPAASFTGTLMLATALNTAAMPQPADASTRSSLPTLVMTNRRRNNFGIQFERETMGSPQMAYAAPTSLFNQKIIDAIDALHPRREKELPFIDAPSMETPDEPIDTATDIPNFLSQNFDKENVPGLKISDNGKITYSNQDQTWTVAQKVYDSNALTSQMTGVPARYLFAVQALESSFKHDVVNEIKACGLSQFVPGTLHEKTYKYAALIGFPEAADLVKRFVRKRDKDGNPYFGYKPKNDAAAKKLEQICLGTDFNTRLGAVNMIFDIRHLQRKLSKHAPKGHVFYPVTEAQAYVAHFAGGGTGRKVLNDVLGNGGKSHAYKSFSKAARTNKTNMQLLYVNGDKKRPRTTAEFMSYLSKTKGLSDHVLPDMRDWGSRKAYISAQRTKLESIETAERVTEKMLKRAQESARERKREPA